MSDLPYSAEAVGRRIRHIRDAHGLSQSAFAERAGVSASALGNWELGMSRPSVVSAQFITRAYDLTLDYLFLGMEDTLRHSVFVHLNSGR
jgi:transcriptional regulator with XRE-family HTH domain